MNHALPSESYIARLDYLAFNGKVCSSVEYSDEQRFLEDLKESLYHGEPLSCTETGTARPFPVRF